MDKYCLFVHWRCELRKKEQRNIRIAFKVNSSIDNDLEAFSKMVSIPKATLVSIVMIDGFRQYKKGRISVEALYSASPRMLEETKSSRSIKFSIAEEIYKEIKMLISDLNRREDDPVNMQSLFLGFWLWYVNNIFYSLHFHITNLRSRERELEGAVSSFYKNKAIDYGVPVSNLQSFYLAKLLSDFLFEEGTDSYEMRENTRLLLDPFDME